MRVDRLKGTKKVIEEVIVNPLQTQREIAKNTWVSKSAVWRALKELGQIGPKDDKILAITDTDLSIVEKWQREIDRRLWNHEELEKMRTVEISQVLRESTARYTLFRWTATDSSGWAKEVIIEI